MSDDPGMDKILDQIGKLLGLAAKAGTQAEGEAAAAKAQELMDKYNLDTAALERRSGITSGKREKEMLDGGYYAYQRALMRKVAELNFCMYFCEEYREVRTKDRVDRKMDGVTVYVYKAGTTIWKTRHRLVGKAVNVAATKVMVAYLNQAINRVLRERVTKSDGTIGAGQLHSGAAVSFREGAVARLIDKLEDAREEAENKRKADRKRAAKVSGAASGTALTLLDVKESEHAANYDFLYGDGAWARVMEARVESAAQRKREHERMAALAASDPAAYRLEEAKRRKEARKYSGHSYRTTSRITDRQAYNAGFDAAEGISLHQQVDTGSNKMKRIGHGT